MDALKQRVAQEVERLADDLTALSHDIHAHPELAFEETHAAERLYITQQSLSAKPTSRSWNA